MDEERDLVVFEDDAGNELTMEVLDYLMYECKEYAMLTELVEDEDEADEDTETRPRGCSVPGDEGVSEQPQAQGTMDTRLWFYLENNHFSHSPLEAPTQNWPQRLSGGWAGAEVRKR